MVRQVDAIFSQGAFRPVDPIVLPEGTRVRLSVVEEQSSAALVPHAARVMTPKLAHPQDVADFKMDVTGADDADVVQR